MDRAVIKDLGARVKDLGKPRQSIYWLDLVACIAVAVTGLYVSKPFPDKILAGSPIALCGVVVAAFALYRATYFNHELAHHPRDLRAFTIGWNLLIGIPLLVPSFLYSDHLNHHSIKNFARDSDVEYLVPELCGIRGAVLLVATCFLLPVSYFGRFLLLPPLAWCSPAIRRWVDIRLSGLGLFGLSKRKPPSSEEIVSWRLQEFGCFSYAAAVVIGIANGLVTSDALLHGYTVLVILLLLHVTRIMVGHRYDAGGSRDRIDQVLDSYNFTRNRLVTRLMAPLGFELHGLHHLFPNIPYHNMPEAHRRISAALPKDSFYHAIESPSYFREVWRFLTRRPRTTREQPQSPRPTEERGAAAAGFPSRWNGRAVEPL
jgi:fatty acid desaturase